MTIHDELLRLRRENAALHRFRRAALGLLTDIRRDMDRAEVLLAAGLEMQEYASVESVDEVLPGDEPGRGDVVFYDPPTASERVVGDDQAIHEVTRSGVEARVEGQHARAGDEDEVVHGESNVTAQRVSSSYDAVTVTVTRGVTS